MFFKGIIGTNFVIMTNSTLSYYLRDKLGKQSVPGSIEATVADDSVLIVKIYLFFCNVTIFIASFFFCLTQFLLVPAIRSCKQFKMYNTA